MKVCAFDPPTITTLRSQLIDVSLPAFSHRELQQKRAKPCLAPALKEMIGQLREVLSFRGSQNLGLAYFGFLCYRVDISMLFRLSETQVSLLWWSEREREKERNPTSLAVQKKTLNPS